MQYTKNKEIIVKNFNYFKKGCFKISFNVSYFANFRSLNTNKIKY